MLQFSRFHMTFLWRNHSTFVADLNQSAYIVDEDNYLGLGKDEIRWSKIGGADEDLFYLDPNGSLYFRAPSDADGNSTSFALDVNASDGRGGWDSGSFNIEVSSPGATRISLYGSLRSGWA